MVAEYGDPQKAVAAYMLGLAAEGVALILFAPTSDDSNVLGR